ncbi:MAG: hypothetical protein HW398_105 [Acidobacteria bacterium]|nr:hypothetical protein [Acidobacteriota bacterium]
MNCFGLGTLGSLVVWGILGVSFAAAQAAGEYAGAVSSMGSVGVGAAQPKVPDKLPAAAPSNSREFSGTGGFCCEARFEIQVLAGAKW